jgi:phosphatidylglycerophosphate synthase
MTAVVGKASKIRFRIVGDCSVPVWGLSSRERLRRQLKLAGVTEQADASIPAPDATVVLLRADHVFDQRIVSSLVQAPGTVLETSQGPNAVAAHVDAASMVDAERLLVGEVSLASSLALRRATPESISGAYVEELLKSEIPIVLHLRAEEQGTIERRLFDGSYKGVTDIVTKYVWPLPARWATRFCANAGIRPNQVTSVSITLVIVATVLFARGWFGIGLLLAWFMTFLDTVDGKLARVTVSPTRLGHWLDKLLDIIHPPFWYIAWGIGLQAPLAPAEGALRLLLGVIVGGYIAGRLAEGGFTLLLGGFSMFCWRPFDSYFRLVLARRNPCLIVLTLGWLVGRPDWGLVAVAVWTVTSGVILLVRFIQGVYRRLVSGPLTPWLEGSRRAQMVSAIGGLAEPANPTTVA